MYSFYWHFPLEETFCEFEPLNVFVPIFCQDSFCPSQTARFEVITDVCPLMSRKMLMRFWTANQSNEKYGELREMDPFI